MFTLFISMLTAAEIVHVNRPMSFVLVNVKKEVAKIERTMASVDAPVLKDQETEDDSFIVESITNSKELDESFNYYEDRSLASENTTVPFDIDLDAPCQYKDWKSYKMANDLDQASKKFNIRFMDVKTKYQLNYLLRNTDNETKFKIINTYTNYLISYPDSIVLEIAANPLKEEDIFNRLLEKNVKCFQQLN